MWLCRTRRSPSSSSQPQHRIGVSQSLIILCKEVVISTMSNARQEVRQCEKRMSYDQRQPTSNSNKLDHQTTASQMNSSSKTNRKILLLHGNQQTGDILLGV